MSTNQALNQSLLASDHYVDVQKPQPAYPAYPTTNQTPANAPQPSQPPAYPPQPVQPAAYPPCQSYPASPPASTAPVDTSFKLAQQEGYLSEPPPQYYHAVRPGFMQQLFACHNLGPLCLGIFSLSFIIGGLAGGNRTCTTSFGTEWCTGLGVSLGFLIPGVVFYIFYVIWACCGQTKQFLSHQTSSAGIMEYTDSLRQAAPSLHFNVRCWHTETYTETSTDAQGKTTTQTKTRSVTTFSAQYPVYFSGWKDVSGALAGISDEDTTRLKIRKEYQFSDPQTANTFEGMGAYLYMANCHRDTHCDVNPAYDIPGYTKNLLCVSKRHQESKPWWLSSTGYLVATVIGLAGAFSIYLECKCMKAEYRVVKCIAGPLSSDSFQFNQKSYY